MLNQRHRNSDESSDDVRHIELSGCDVFYLNLKERVPTKHPLRKLRAVVEALLSSMSAEFDATYSKEVGPSVPPEIPIKALILQIIFSIRSTCLLVESIDYNMLYRWFIGSTHSVGCKQVKVRSRRVFLTGPVEVTR